MSCNLNFSYKNASSYRRLKKCWIDVVKNRNVSMNFIQEMSKISRSEVDSRHWVAKPLLVWLVVCDWDFISAWCEWNYKNAWLLKSWTNSQKFLCNLSMILIKFSYCKMSTNPTYMRRRSRACLNVIGGPSIMLQIVIMLYCNRPNSFRCAFWYCNCNLILQILHNFELFTPK